MGEGVGMLELGCGGLWWKFAGVWIFGQKMAQLFVVLGSGCGELLEWKLGGLRRWGSGEYLGRVWAGSEV